MNAHSDSVFVVHLCWMMALHVTLLSLIRYICLQEGDGGASGCSDKKKVTKGVVFL